MNKILLVYEDYADLMNVEATLKKVGFDVIGLTNEYTVAEQVLAFNPDLVVGSGRGGKVSSLGVGKRLKEMHRWQGKSVLIFQPHVKPEPQELIRIRVDMMLEAPVPALRLIQVLGKLLGHDESLLLERLNKAAPEGNPAKGFNISNNTSVSGKFNTDGEAIYIKGRTEDVAKNADERALRSEKINPEDGMNFSFKNEESEETKKVSFRFGDRMSEAAAVPNRKDSEDSSATMFADVDLKALEKELLGGGAPEVDRIEETELEKPVQKSNLTVVSENGDAPDSAANNLSGNPNSERLSENLAPGEALAPEALNQVQGGVVQEDASVEVSNGIDETQALQAKARRELETAEKALKNRMAKYANIVADVKVAPKSTVSRVEARRRQRALAAEWDKENLNDIDELRREFTKALFKK